METFFFILCSNRNSFLQPNHYSKGLNQPIRSAFITNKARNQSTSNNNPGHQGEIMRSKGELILTHLPIQL